MVLDAKEVEDRSLGLGGHGPQVLIGTSEVDFRIGCHLVEHVPEIPVVPVPRLDGRGPASQFSEDCQGDEVDGQPAIHGLLTMHVEPVAVLQGFGGILLSIGENDPEAVQE